MLFSLQNKSRIDIDGGAYRQDTGNTRDQDRDENRQRHQQEMEGDGRVEHIHRYRLRERKAQKRAEQSADTAEQESLAHEFHDDRTVGSAQRLSSFLISISNISIC